MQYTTNSWTIDSASISRITHGATQISLLGAHGYDYEYTFPAEIRKIDLINGQLSRNACELGVMDVMKNDWERSKSVSEFQFQETTGRVSWYHRVTCL